MKVYELLDEDNLSALSNAVRQSASSTRRTNTPATTPTTSSSGNNVSDDASVNDRINRHMPALFAELDAALQSRSKPALMELVLRGADSVINRDPDIRRVATQHSIDRIKYQIRDRMFDRLARGLRSSQAAGTRGRNWVGYARSNPERFIDIVLDPSLANRMGL
jgi:hypothetical protein